MEQLPGRGVVAGSEDWVVSGKGPALTPRSPSCRSRPTPLTAITSRSEAAGCPSGSAGFHCVGWTACRRRGSEIGGIHARSAGPFRNGRRAAHEEQATLTYGADGLFEVVADVRDYFLLLPGVVAREFSWRARARSKLNSYNERFRVSSTWSM